jgi:hypothetical protein
MIFLLFLLFLAAAWATHSVPLLVIAIALFCFGAGRDLAKVRGR